MNGPEAKLPWCQIFTHVTDAGVIRKHGERMLDVRDDAVCGLNLIARNELPDLQEIETCARGKERCHARRLRRSLLFFLISPNTWSLGTRSPRSSSSRPTWISRRSSAT